MDWIDRLHRRQRQVWPRLSGVGGGQGDTAVLYSSGNVRGSDRVLDTGSSAVGEISSHAQTRCQHTSLSQIPVSFWENEWKKTTWKTVVIGDEGGTF